MGLWLVSQWAVPALLHPATAVRHEPFSGVIINFKTKAFDWLLSDSYMSLVISELVTPYKLITCMPANESESCGLASLVRRVPFLCPWSIFYRKLSVTRLAVLPLVGHEQPFFPPWMWHMMPGKFWLYWLFAFAWISQRVWKFVPFHPWFDLFLHREKMKQNRWSLKSGWGLVELIGWLCLWWDWDCKHMKKIHSYMKNTCFILSPGQAINHSASCWQLLMLLIWIPVYKWHTEWAVFEPPFMHLFIIV